MKFNFPKREMDNRSPEIQEEMRKLWQAMKDKGMFRGCNSYKEWTARKDNSNQKQ